MYRVLTLLVICVCFVIGLRAQQLPPTKPVSVNNLLSDDVNNDLPKWQRIGAEYEELPAVFDEVEAMTSKAIVHEVLKPAGTFPDLKHLQGKTNTNVALDFHLRRGDAIEALK